MIQMINQPANGITYQGQDGQIIQDGQPIYIETQAQTQQVPKQYHNGTQVDTLNWSSSMKNVFFTP